MSKHPYKSAQRVFVCTKRDADLFDAEVTRRRQLGSLHVLRVSRTLDTFIRDSWAPERAQDLASATRVFYAGLHRTHLAPTFADTPIRDITAPRVAAWRAARQRRRRHEGAARGT